MVAASRAGRGSRSPHPPSHSISHHDLRCRQLSAYSGRHTDSVSHDVENHRNRDCDRPIAYSPHLSASAMVALSRATSARRVASWAAAALAACFTRARCCGGTGGDDTILHYSSPFTHSAAHLLHARHQLVGLLIRHGLVTVGCALGAGLAGRGRGAHLCLHRLRLQSVGVGLV